MCLGGSAVNGPQTLLHEHCCMLGTFRYEVFILYADWQDISSRIVCYICMESPVELFAVLARNLQSNCVLCWQGISSRIVCCIDRESPVARCAFPIPPQQAVGRSVWLLCPTPRTRNTYCTQVCTKWRRQLEPPQLNSNKTSKVHIK